MPLEPPTLIARSAPAADVRFLDRSQQQAADIICSRQPANRYLADKLPSIPAVSRPTGSSGGWSPKLIRVLSEDNSQCHPVKSLPLPAPGWWMNHPNRSGEGYCVQLSPTRDEETCITLQSTGNGSNLAQADEPERAFREAVYKKPPHMLTRVELEAIKGKAAAEFTLAQTIDLKGKRVLELAGHFKESNQDVYRLQFNDRDDANQEFAMVTLDFTAKPDKFRKYFKAVKHCFSQIQWSTKSEVPTK
jgi:hypothetical protein